MDSGCIHATVSESAEIQIIIIIIVMSFCITNTFDWGVWNVPNFLQ